jgi:hypothetical protein
MPDFTNPFEFIDYLESFGRSSGTANENRAFIFNTIASGFNAFDNPDELFGAYIDVGITVPRSAFDSILENRQTFSGYGQMIQILAPTSLIPGSDLAEFNGNLGSNYIVYGDITFVNNITGDIIQKGYYVTFDDEMTPSQIKASMSSDYATHYNVNVLSVDMQRIFRA